MLPIVLDPIESGMTIVLGRDAAKKHKTQKHRVGLVTKVARNRPPGITEPIETFTVEILTPRKSECSCLIKKKHRTNQTTGEHVCTDKLGEYRHGHLRTESPKVITLARSDFWKIQEFVEDK